MLAKLFAIARKDIYTTFQDRQALIVMFAAPLALSLIIGLAFGSAGDISIDQVPVTVLNADTGSEQMGMTFNLGAIIQNALVPTGDPATEENFAMLRNLVDGELTTDAEAARTAVDDGDRAALITIPADFTTSVLADQPRIIEVYADSGRSIGPSIVLSIVRGLANGMNTVVLAQQIGPGAVAELGAQVGADDTALRNATSGVQAEAMMLGSAQPIMLESVDLQGKTRVFDALQFFAPSMAILFMTFAAAGSATTILREQQRWTLQRIISSPTPRWVFMGGKLAGTYLTGVIQMIVLIISTSMLAAMMGRESSVWGSNVVGIALLVLAVVLAGTSLGLLIAALARTTDQAGALSTAIIFLMGMIGGSFFESSALPPLLPRLTLHYWGIQGFVELSYNEAPISDILPHLLALLAIGAVLFTFSLWRFNRRLDV